jgi:hypothetical protein
MLAAGIAGAFGVVLWADHFISDPNAEDFRIRLVTARVGLKYGWSHIYDIDLQKAASAGLGREGSLVDSMHLFISPPPAAWVVHLSLPCPSPPDISCGPSSTWPQSSSHGGWSCRVRSLSESR